MAKILIVDDSKTSRRFLKDMLVSAGHEVVADFGSKEEGTYVDVQPSCELYGQAYDDDGLAEITINVYKEVDGGWAKLETNSKVIDLSEKSYPTYYLV